MDLITPTPLTTIFSLPSSLATSCFSQLYQADTVAVVLGPGAQCLPPGPAPVSSTLSTYYSPGLWDGRPACPDQWTPACTQTITSGTITETAVTCCPNANGLGPLSYVSFTCQQSESISLYIGFNQYGCTMQLGALASYVSLTVLNTNSLPPTTKVMSVQPNQGPNAYSVQVRWQESDLHSVVPTQPSSTPTSPSSSSDSNSGGQSSSAKIAVGVVIPVVVLAAVMIGLLIYRRKKKANKANHSVCNQDMQRLNEENWAVQKEAVTRPSELEANRYASGSRSTHELSVTAL